MSDGIGETHNVIPLRPKASGSRSLEEVERDQNSDRNSASSRSEESLNQALLSRAQMKPSAGYFYSHGKLLLTGEYLLTEGARGLALPTVHGQALVVRKRKSFDPKLVWKSIDPSGKVWAQAEFELWRFRRLVPSSEGEGNGSETILDPNESLESQNQANHLPSSNIEVINNSSIDFVQKLLRAARDANPHFLREELSYEVEARLEFSPEWGLGSSSTLIHNIAEWAYCSPFRLSKAMNPKGSGYDIACAQSQSPLVYHLGEEDKVPQWKLISFNPKFSENLYFLYSGQKRGTIEALSEWDDVRQQHDKTFIQSSIKRVNEITDALATCGQYSEFIELLAEHEELISKVIKRPTVQELYQKRMNGFKGQLKSLGAWGGDFILVASKQTPYEIKSALQLEEDQILIPFQSLILNAKSNGRGLN